jgi:hypothetical protein
VTVVPNTSMGSFTSAKTKQPAFQPSSTSREERGQSSEVTTRNQADFL